jgi:hypothetical protein
VEQAGERGDATAHNGTLSMTAGAMRTHIEEISGGKRKRLHTGQTQAIDAGRGWVFGGRRRSSGAMFGSGHCPQSRISHDDL